MNSSLASLLLLLFSYFPQSSAFVAPSSRHLSLQKHQQPFSIPYNTPTHQVEKSRRRPTTELQALPAVIAAITGAISGGLFAGGLHAIAGPDHLAALLPRCCGQRWYKAGRVGALWGMGHGVSAALIGSVAFGLKNFTLSRNTSLKFWMTGASHITEAAVGLSLIIIGIMGIREAREWKEVKSLSAAATDPRAQSTNRAVIFNGILHGFSWDGAPSLAPALAVATWGSSLAFLMAYAVGTMSAMAIVTTFVGEGTRRAGELFQRPDIPQKLSVVSSGLAIAIGVIWCGLAVV